jgi:DNA-binding PadR family transcriptional regulator
LLARNPRGATEVVLVLGHGFSREMLAKLVLAGLATVVTEPLRADGHTIKVERFRITDSGRRALERRLSPGPPEVF